MNIRIPVSWLREYLKTDAATKTIVNFLSLAGPSVEKVKKDNDEFILDIEVTGNRQDSFSVYGIAREANAILINENFKSQLVTPKGLNLSLEPDISNPLSLNVKIENRHLCPRFSAIIIDNINIKPSPAHIRQRLEYAGIRPINNIVDISNYIMLELGQPMHTFDFDKIKKQKMILRPSVKGEKIQTLDGKVRKLPKGAIVIEDEGRLIDLCGIMGGKNSQITKRTKRAILFVQAYDPVTIRKTTQALTFRTEAAARFEKGIDLEGIIPALSRAVFLAKQFSGARIASELIDINWQKSEPKTVNLSSKKLKDYLDIELTPNKILKILNPLGFKVKTSPQLITATVPSWRLLDIAEDVDLIEEIARIYGYRRLPSKLPEGQIPQGSISNLTQVIELKKALKYLGLTEVISYSIISKNLLDICEIDSKDAVGLTNPLTDQWQFMRPTLLISLTQIIANNQNFQDDMNIFEIANTYLNKENSLPQQDLMLAIVMQNTDFYHIKGMIENVFGILERSVIFEKPKKNHPLLEKKLQAHIKIGETNIGMLGILKESINEYFGINYKIAASEINLSAIYQQPSTQISYKSISKYPPVIEDLSMVFNKGILLFDILAQIKKADRELIGKIEVIDIFQDPKIGKDKKSITFRLIYERPDRTPMQGEVKAVREKIVDILTKSFAAVIRR